MWHGVTQIWIELTWWQNSTKIEETKNNITNSQFFHIYCKHLACERGQIYAAPWDFCLPCDTGSYSETNHAITCTPCPDGLTTHSPGRTNSSECVKGEELSANIIITDLLHVSCYKTVQSPRAILSLSNNSKNNVKTHFYY